MFLSVRKQQGFTMIELIMVIVILGILSAFALPRFADLSDDARIASMEGARAAVKSASGIVHASYLAKGSPASGSIDIEDVNLVVGTDIVDGYPAQTKIMTLAGLDEKFTSTGTAPRVITLTGLAAVGDLCFAFTNAVSPAAPTITALKRIASVGPVVCTAAL